MKRMEKTVVPTISPLKWEDSLIPKQMMTNGR